MNHLATVQGHLKKHSEVETAFGKLAVVSQPIGQGGNAVVYPVDFEGPAVIKVLLEPVGAKASTKLERFQREYRRLITVPPHPNLIRLFHYEALQIGTLKFPAIIMERCDDSLASYAKNQSSFQRLDDLCRQLASVLDHIHAHGIIHRDIKPENILVRADGSFVLADFGIAKFDPKLFLGKQLTKKGDRMANFAFSAPEQFEKSPQLGTTADIYSFGQVLYWCVTKTTYRGNKPPKMSEVDSSYRNFDELVDSMSAHEPTRRLDSGRKVIDTLDQVEKQRKEREFNHHVIECLEHFDRAIRKSSPGLREIIRCTSADEIDRLLNELANICQTHELWWTVGNANMSISEIKVADGIRVIGNIELEITDCWMYRSGSDIDHCFVMLRSDPMPSFDESGVISSEYEEKAWFNGRYITRAEYDDGYAVIDGQTEEVSGAEVRCRFLHQSFFFIATKFNSILQPAADTTISRLVQTYQNGQAVDMAELRTKLQKLPIHQVSQLMS